MGRRRGRVAPPGATECVLSLYVPDEDAVRARYEAALVAGGSSVYEPSQREWGAFAARSPNLTSTSGSSWSC